MDNSAVISLGGNIWRETPVDESWCERVAQTYDLSPYLAQLLYKRQVVFDEVPDFLQPKLQKLMPDPYVLKDMQKAAERVAKAVLSGEKIAIIGDYDVDGATSTAELTRFLHTFGINPVIHIPSREEGYGPSDLAMKGRSW